MVVEVFHIHFHLIPRSPNDNMAATWGHWKVNKLSTYTRLTGSFYWRFYCNIVADDLCHIQTAQLMICRSTTTGKSSTSDHGRIETHSQNVTSYKFYPIIRVSSVSCEPCQKGKCELKRAVTRWAVCFTTVFIYLLTLNY
jgi:hypothetical protein